MARMKRLEVVGSSSILLIALMLSGCEAPGIVSPSCAVLTEATPSAQLTVNATTPENNAWTVAASDPRITLFPESGEQGESLAISALDFSAYFTARMVVRAGSSGAYLGQCAIAVGDPVAAGVWTMQGVALRLDKLYSVLATRDGGYLLAGEIEEIAAIVRLDADRNLLWEHVFSPLDMQRATKLLETATGDFVVGGYLENEAKNFKFLRVARFTATGAVIWQRQYPYAACTSLVALAEETIALSTTHLDVVHLDATGDILHHGFYGSVFAAATIAPFRITPLEDGGVVAMAGVWHNLLVPLKEVILVKYTAAGEEIFHKTHPFQAIFPTLPIETLKSRQLLNVAIEEASTGAIYIAGSLESYFFGPRERQLILIKLSATGDLLWSKIFNTLGRDKDTFVAMQETAAGSLLLAGTSGVGIDQFAGPADAVILFHIDADGTELWQRTLPGQGVRGMDITADGSILLAGQQDEEAALYKTTLEGYGIVCAGE